MAGERETFTFPDPDNAPDAGQKAENGSVTVDISADGADVEIEVKDTTPPQDRNRTPSEPPTDPTDEELSEYSEKVRKRVQHFTKGYHDERRAKEAAQRERDEAARLAQAVLEENKRLKSTLDVGQNAFVEQARRQLEGELAQVKGELKAAHEAFDPEAIAEAQTKLTQIALKLDRAQNFKPRPVQQQENAVQHAPEAPSQPRLDPTTLAWYGRNQWFGKDREMTRMTEGIHEQLVVEEGIRPASEEYFRRIDQRLRQVFPDRFGDDTGNGGNSNPDRAPDRQRTVAAPNRGAAPRKITLTTEQVNLARRLNVPLKEYALQVAELQRKA